MDGGFAPAEPGPPTAAQRRRPEQDEPVMLGYTPDHLPVVIWHRDTGPVLEIGCVQIRLYRLTDELRAGLAQCLQNVASHSADSLLRCER